MAGQDRAAAWIDGRIADGWPRPPGPARLLATVVVLVLLVDLCLAVALRGSDRDPTFLLDGADVRAVIDEAAGDPGSWLMIGDSVLVGDVMHGRVPDWEQHRVIDYLALEQAPMAGKGKGRVRFRQVALDGLLPTDIERIVAELDRRDPEGAVPLVIELNLRYFSPHHERELGCTRPWICELGDLDLGRRGITAIAHSPLAWLAAELRPTVPILRHKRRLDLDRAITEASERLTPARERDGDELREVEGTARISEHYRESALGKDSAQIRAIDRVLERLRARGRHAVFFTTPLRDNFVADVVGEETLGGRYAALAERIHDSGADASLVQLDHPLFVPELFLDHCHLGPAGNRLLALNLLHALDVRLARMPDALESIRTEGPHETLVGRVDTGYAEGAGWQALFNHPEGLAVRAQPREVIVADTGNHVLRRLRGNFETTELLAGKPGEAGASDGRAFNARLAEPRLPCIVDDAVYFIDGARRRLRALADGKVKWVGTNLPDKASAIRCLGDSVWLLAGDTLHEYSPMSGSVHKFALRSGPERIKGRTFALASDGRIFIVAADNRILVGRPRRGGARVDLAVLFANAGKEPLPRERERKFPYRFDEIRFDAVADIAYVERYGGLLVQDVVTPKIPVVGLTENVHLRYLDLEERKVYPWIKPEVYSQSYVMYNEPADTLVSGFHQGIMALDQASASLFYLEQGRSRLYRIDDGILGAAKISHFGGNAARLPLPDRMGAKLGRLVQARMSPHRYLDARWERRPRRGPYLGLLVGSSKSAYHDIIGEYSLGRRIEHELAAELGYRDHIRFDLYQRTAPSVTLAAMVETIHESEELELPFDIAFLEIYGLFDRFLGESKSEAEQRALLGELEAIRRETGMLIVFIDTTTMGSRRRDAMRAAPREVVQFIALAERFGFSVLRPGDRLLREHLDYSAWGNQPWSRKRFQHHGSTWGIDLTGAMLASMAYPLVAAHVEDRQPRHLDPDTRLARRRDPSTAPELDLLVAALAEIDPTALPAIDLEAVQIRHDRGHLRLFVDRGRPGARGEPHDVVLAILYALLVDDIYGALAERATIDLARFRSYNEYGLGVLDAAEVESRYTFGPAELAVFVREALAHHPELAKSRGSEP